MTLKEIIEMLMLLKESVEQTVGNRLDRNQKYTILSDIAPSSFKYVIDRTVQALEQDQKEQWQELKETITELRDNDGTGTQQEVCKFLSNLMDVLENQMQEPKTDILDKIRAEIETEKVGYPPSADYYKAIMKVLEIIDKYRQEG